MVRLLSIMSDGKIIKAHLRHSVTQFVQRRDHRVTLRHLPERIAGQIQRAALQPRPGNAVPNQVGFEQRNLERAAIIHAIVRVDGGD